MLLVTVDAILIYLDALLYSRDIMAKEKMLNDEEILEALNISLKNACIPASAVADVLGVNSRYVKDRLLELKEKGLVNGAYRGNSWCFRPTR